MARMFTHIIDSRFTAGDENQLRALLRARIEETRKALHELGGVAFAFSRPRLLKFTQEESGIQWRADCWMYKSSRQVRWDDVYAVVNTIKAVPYDPVGDREALHQIKVLSEIAHAAQVSQEELHHEEVQA